MHLIASHCISTQTQWFELLLEELLEEVSSEVRDILIALRLTTSYDDIKDVILKRLAKYEKSRIQQ